MLAVAPIIWAEDSCLLVHDGQPRATIVIAAKPARAAQFAAAELAHYTQKLAGASLPIVTEDNLTSAQAASDLVLVGESERTRQIGLTNAALKPQEHIIRNAGRWLVLMGRDEEDFGPVDYAKDYPWPECRLDFPRRVQFKHWGSLYAVDTFLERVCGVRWYMPGELGEVAPKMRTIEARGLNLRLKPWTKYRIIGHTWAWDPFDFYAPGRDPKKGLPQREMLLWWLRMKLGGEPFNVNHSVYSYFDRFADAHPDWFADGKPVRGGHLCYTHPGFIAQHAQDARDYFDGKYPTMLFPKGGQVPAAGDYYPAVPIDSSSGWCQCPRCNALLEINQPIAEDIPGASFFNGRYSEYVWTFANAVAREVRKTHPDKRISAIAYARYFRPPQHVTLEPNLSVGVTKQVMLYGNPKAKQYFNDTLREWHARVGELYIWEYYLNQYFNKFCAFPWITPRLIGEDIEFLKTVGVVGKFVETSPWKSRRANLAEDLLPVYVTAKLLADDSRSVGDILAEHYRLFYGPAATPMKAFYEKIEATWRDTTMQAHKAGGQRLSWELMCPPPKLKEFHALMTQAVALAKTEPYATRVRLMNEAIYQPMEKQCLEYAERSKSRRRMACPLISAPPVIDGKLDDASWKQAAHTPPLVGMTAEKVDVETVACVARDERMLYVALDCPEPAMNTLVASHNKPDSLEVCLDDDVEVFVDVGRTREKYYHLLVNANGTLADRAVGMGLDEGGVGWNSGAKVATARSDRGWTVEMAIPLQSLNAAPKPGDVWGFNACRVRRGAVKDIMGQTTCWSPTFGGFNTPDEFGTLEMAAAASAAGRNDSLTPVIALNFDEAITDNTSHLSVGPGVNGITATAQLQQLRDGKPWNASCQAAGKSGGGCTFDATAKRYITVQIPETFGLSRGDFTAMLWLKTASDDSQCLLGSTTSAPFWILAINKIGEKRLLRFLMGTGPPTTVVNADAPPADGRWHHAAVTVDRGKLATLFCDGELLSASDISHHKGALKNILTVGGPYNSFSGCVDTVQVYRGALSPTDIKAIYQQQQAGIGGLDK
jgi:hypothetical protein